MLQRICRKLGTYAQSVKNMAKRFCDFYRSNPRIKREKKTIRGFQTLLGYGNYYSFKKQVYAIMIVSMYGNLGDIVDDPHAHILRLLPQTIVLDPPEQAEFNSFVEELRSELESRAATLVLTPIGAVLGGAGGASADKDCPLRGAAIGAGLGSFLAFIAGTIIDVWRSGWNNLWDLTTAPDPVGNVRHSPQAPLAPKDTLDTGGVEKFVGPNGEIIITL